MITQNELIASYLNPLKPLFDDINITDIYVDRFDKISFKSKNIIYSSDAVFEDERDLNEGLRVLALSLDDVFSSDHPLLAARLPGGSRLSAAHRSRCPTGTSCSIRIHRGIYLTLSDLYSYGTLTEEMYSFLNSEMVKASNILFSGPTGSGKTTLFDILISSIPSKERVLRAEDTAELKNNSLFGVGYESREKNSYADKDRDPVLLYHLVRHVLRNDADRLLVGEIRDSAAAAAFLRAMSTGHTGACSTIHANNAKNAFMNFLIMACGSKEYHRVPFEHLRSVALSSVSLLVHMNKSRIISEIVAIKDGDFKTLFSYDESTQKHMSES